MFTLQLSRTRLKGPKVPLQILLSYERLLSDDPSFSPEEVRTRWAEFENPKFDAALELIAEGHPDLVADLAVTDLNPPFVHFLPREPSESLISAGE
jgi:hypothetical protein